MLALRPLTRDDLDVVELWFDELDTARFLGGREWPREALRLATVVVGESAAGVITTDRQIFLAVHDRAGAVGLIDIEVYDNRTASCAFVVAPHLRRNGWGRAILNAAEALSIVADVDTLVGHVDANNEASVRCLRSVGYTIGDEADDQGLRAAFKPRAAIAGSATGPALPLVGMTVQTSPTDPL